MEAELKALIHVGTFDPGDRLPPERQLCDLLQVSRSTLREGLRALRTAGYLESRRGPAGGTFVSQLDVPFERWIDAMRSAPDKLREITDLRCAIECEITRLATERCTAEQLDELAATLEDGSCAEDPREFRDADARFHVQLAEGAAAPRLKTLMLEARAELFVPASSNLIRIAVMTRSHSEHLAIFAALRHRDSDLAAKKMREHLHSTFDDVASVINGFASPGS